MSAARRTFIRGNRNPNTYGYSLRASCGDEPDQQAIAQAATVLGREPFFVDRKGYECEIIAAAMNHELGHVAYVESRAKKKWWSSVVDISIKIHLCDTDGTNRSVDIKSYNPFFGCDVRFFQWYGDTCVLIYREKHDTYACRFGIDDWPPSFTEIEDRWLIKDSVLAYIGYKEEVVRRMTIPDLDRLGQIALSDAAEQGLRPPDLYAE
jgi:hypothetical protein